MDIFEEVNNLGTDDPLGNSYDEVEKYLESQGYNLVELGRIIREQGTQQIITGAGSGKTTAIILKSLADLKTGNSSHKVEHKGMTTEVSDKIWISTFLKSGAEDLKRTLERKRYEMGITTSTDNIKFSTLHAEFKHALNQMGVPTNLMKSGVALKLLREVAKDFGLGSRPQYPTNEELMSIQSYISAARNKLNPEQFDHPEMGEVGLTTDNIGYVIKLYKKLREKYKVNDFEDLQELLYRYACSKETRNVNVTNFIMNRFDKIIIDEFQDVSEIQYEILKVYAQGCRSFVAVGDDDQTIYSWRGSDINIITKKFKEDFNPVINKLSVNYRCPSNILNPIAKSIKLNENRYEKPLKSFNEGGELNCYAYKSTIEMARSVEQQIMADVREGKTVAVLARTNPSLLPLSLYLDFQNNFKYAIRGNLYDLGRIKFKAYWRLAYLFKDGGNFFVENLKQLAPDEPKYRLKNFTDALKTEGRSFFTFPISALRNISSQLADFREYYDQYKDLEEIEKFRAVLNYVKYMRVGERSEEVHSVIELLEIIIEEGNCTNIDEFLYEIDYRNQRLHGHAENKDLTIQLTTVHDFKGKEADSVYIWKDTDKMFPSERSNDEDFEEERRVHYIAGTRAKEKSTILTIAGQESPFISEMGITPKVFLGEGSSRTLKDKHKANLEGADKLTEGLL